MNKQFLVVGFLSGLLLSGVAQAGVLINSINVTSPLYGHDGYSDNTSLLGQSFYAPTAPSSSATATLLLSAANPNDGGAISIYLVADDGSGGATGIAGNATYAPRSGGTSFTGLTNDVLLGSIADSSLSTTPKQATIGISAAAFAAVSPKTFNGEYWLVANIGGNQDEWYNNDGNPSGFGSAGQAYWNNFNGVYGSGTPVTPGDGPYDLIVNTPEPATLALLGVGIAGLGYFRRRSACDAL